MSNTKKTANSKVSNNSIMITYDSTSFEIDVQLDNSEIGIIIVVSNTK